MKTEKNALRTMETPTAVLKNLCREIETEFFEAKLDSKETQENGKEKLII